MHEISTFIKITDLSMMPSLAAYARSEQLRGRSLMDTMRKLMKFWLSFCLKQVPKGDRAKVESYLLAINPGEKALQSPSRAAGLSQNASKRSRSRAARVDRLRGTRLAVIMRKFNIYGAKAIRNPERFYQLCARYLSRRKAGVNVHRASLIDPLKRFKGTASHSAKLKKSPHAVFERASENFAKLAVDAWGSARITPQNPSPKGMEGIAGRVFFRTMRMVETIAKKWLLERLVKGARQSGFQARVV